MKYEEVLKNYRYENPEPVLERVESLRDEDSLEDLYMIVLWKTNRLILAEDLKIIKKDLAALAPITSYSDKKDEVIKLLTYMLGTKGIQLPMASTILHFYYPDVFPIIDQRAYRAASLPDTFFDQEFEEERYKKEDKNEYPRGIQNKAAPDLYFEYIKRCKKIIEMLQDKEEGISMKTIDQFLYAMDKAAGMRVEY